jgi:regulatory protein
LSRKSSKRSTGDAARGGAPGRAAPRGGAIAAAFKYLSRRPRAEREVRERLTAIGYDAVEVDSALKALLVAGYVDDERYAGLLVDSRLGRRRWGRLKIAVELASKGIPPEHIKTALAGIDHAREREAARAAIEKWRRRSAPGAKGPADVLAKAARFLKGRGFTAETIAAVVFAEDADAGEGVEG